MTPFVSITICIILLIIFVQTSKDLFKSAREKDELYNQKNGIEILTEEEYMNLVASGKIKKEIVINE